MYKEENDMTKSLKDTIVEMWTEASEGFASDAQRKGRLQVGTKKKVKRKKTKVMHLVLLYKLQKKMVKILS